MAREAEPRRQRRRSLAGLGAETAGLVRIGRGVVYSTRATAAWSRAMASSSTASPVAVEIRT